MSFNGQLITESRYHDALAHLLSSKHEQKALYALGDSTIETMLETLHPVRIAQTFTFHIRAHFRYFLTKGVAGERFETQDDE